MVATAINPHALGVELCKPLGLDANRVARIIIDVNIHKNDPVTVYVEMLASPKMLDLDWDSCLEGAEIKILDKEKATGTIIFTREEGAGGIDQVSAKWEGGDVVAFSKEFIENTNPRWFHRLGTGIQACQFRLEVISETDDTVHARRIS